MSASAQPTRASSRNHNHTRTPLQGRASHSRLQPTPAHNPHPNQNTAQRLDMHAPSTPPADPSGAHPDGDPKRGSPGGGEPPTTPNASPRPAKFGASPSAPSFASVVSSSGATRASARSPLSTTPTSSLQQHTQQPQEHAHPSAAPLSLEVSSKTNDGGINTIGDATAAPVAASTAPLSSSPSYQSSLSGSLMPRGADNTTPIIHSDNNTNSAAIDADNADHEQENDPEDSESSDVEIYLNTLGLHDSAARMHVFVGPGATGPNTNTASIRSSSNGMSQIQPSNESPVLPSTAQFSGNATHPSNTLTLRVGAADLNSTKSLSPLSFAQPSSGAPPATSRQHSLQLPHNGTNLLAQAKSPQLPPAPVHGTIPLPHLEDNDYLQDADARQLQTLQQHQQMHSQQHPILHVNGTINLAELTIGGGGGMGEGVRGHPAQLGLPSSHSQPALGVEPPFEAHAQGDASFGSASSFPTSVSDSALGGAGQKTPNVYINGLPPHFREDQLFELACPFGLIRSVRTFTRHVRDSESGYGFVLFETIEAAERCIVSLRRYRNLHPTFSKQIHKIPGTTYAQGAVAPSSTSTWNEQSLDSETGSIGGSNEGSLGAEASFKAKMESLQDPTSTNLYMEGLPLKTEAPDLAKMVAPHVISSHRFFQTRLSNPPKLIAFVRLETRKGAEEVIERLHGCMVREDEHDPGSRISVRFADTSEQRELRRTERSAQDGDISPGHITIAQAALLNLHGKELSSENMGPAIYARGAGAGRLPSVSARGFSTSVSAPDFASNAYLFPSANELAVDYSLAPGRSALVNPASRSRSPYQMQQDVGYLQSDPYSTQGQVGFSQASSASMDPNMASLITSLGNTDLSYQGGYESPESADLEYMQGQGAGHIQHYPPIGHQHHHLATSQSLDDIQHYRRPAPAYTRSGYTPTEEYIMRAHAESAALAHAQAQAQQQQQQQAERRRPAPLDLRRRRGEEGLDDVAPANIAVGMRGYRMQASIGRLGQGLMSPSTSMASPTMGMGMNLMAEDDFHPSAMGGRNGFGQQLSNGNGEVNRAVGSAAHTRHNPNIHPAHVNARLSRDPPPSAPSILTNYSRLQRSPLAISPALPSAPASTQDSPNPNQPIHYQHAAAHLRSTTLPQHRTSSARDGQQMASARGHYQHSSMSMPAQNLRTPQHASVAAFGGAGGIEENAGTIYEDSSREEQQEQQQRSDAGLSVASVGSGSSVVGANAPGSINTAPQLTVKSHYSPTSQNIFGELETSSSTSSLISPTLTYGTQTPSTLSPATPFFGSFNSQTEGFEKGGHGSATDRQQKKQVIAGSAVGLSSLRS